MVRKLTSIRLYIAIFVIGTIASLVYVLASDDTPNVVRINRACAAHHGVSRIDYPYVICRDGHVGEY